MIGKGWSSFFYPSPFILRSHPFPIHSRFSALAIWTLIAGLTRRTYVRLKRYAQSSNNTLPWGFHLFWELPSCPHIHSSRAKKNNSLCGSLTAFIEQQIWYQKPNEQQFWQYLWKKKMFTGKESLVTPCSALVHNYGCGASSPTTIALTSPFQKFSQQIYLFPVHIILERVLGGELDVRPKEFEEVRNQLHVPLQLRIQWPGLLCVRVRVIPPDPLQDKWRLCLRASSSLVTLDHCSAPKINTLTLGSVTLSPPPLPPLLQTDRWGEGLQLSVV